MPGSQYVPASQLGYQMLPQTTIASSGGHVDREQAALAAFLQSPESLFLGI